MRAYSVERFGLAVTAVPDRGIRCGADGIERCVARVYRHHGDDGYPV